MTVIVYRDGIMASDDMSMRGDSYMVGIPKISVVGDCLVGVTGDLIALRILIEWLTTLQESKSSLTDLPRCRAEDLKDTNFEAIIYNRAGDLLLHIDNAGFLTILTVDSYSIGSGSWFALGALHAGASAKEAVQSAIAHTVTCSGDVKTITLDKCSH